MRFRFPKLAKIVLTAIVAVLPCAHATVLYSTDFESFSTGAIAGQDGWSVFGPGISGVESFFAKTGSQAAFVDGGTASQSGPYHSDTTVGPLVDLSADIAIFTSSTQSEWQFAAVGPGLAGYLGGINILADNSIELETPGFPIIGTFTRATAFDSTAWHHIDLLFNIATQTYSVTVDSSTLVSDVPFCGSNSGCTGANVPAYGLGFFDSFGVSGTANDSGFMDNFQVSTVDTVPEPSTLLFAASALALNFVRRRIRR